MRGLPHGRLFVSLVALSGIAAAAACGDGGGVPDADVPAEGTTEDAGGEAEALPPEAGELPPDAGEEDVEGEDALPEVEDVPAEDGDLPSDAADVLPEAEDVPPDTEDVPPEADDAGEETEDGPGEATLPECPAFAAGVTTGIVANDALVELSGIAESRKSPGVFWAHNDSGDSARFFALAADGRHLGTLALTGAGARDWEGMAIGAGEAAGDWFLYAGDIGDNSAVRPDVRVYRVLEPDVDPGAAPVDLAAPADTLTVVYPDGAHNAETLLLDPLADELLIVTKEAPAGAVFRVPGPFVPGAVVTAERVAEIGVAIATAGDISPAGDEILVRGYGSASLWRRVGDESLADAFAREACAVPLVAEPQGEAIAFAADGSGYYSATEGPGGVVTV
jgi:hypothetical protein